LVSPLLQLHMSIEEAQREGKGADSDTLHFYKGGRKKKKKKGAGCGQGKGRGKALSLPPIAWLVPLALAWERRRRKREGKNGSFCFLPFVSTEGRVLTGKKKVETYWIRADPDGRAVPG